MCQYAGLSSCRRHFIMILWWPLHAIMAQCEMGRGGGKNDVNCVSIRIDMCNFVLWPVLMTTRILHRTTHPRSAPKTALHHSRMFWQWNGWCVCCKYGTLRVGRGVWIRFICRLHIVSRAAPVAIFALRFLLQIYNRPKAKARKKKCDDPTARTLSAMPFFCSLSSSLSLESPRSIRMQTAIICRPQRMSKPNVFFLVRRTADHRFSHSSSSILHRVYPSKIKFIRITLAIDAHFHLHSDEFASMRYANKRQMHTQSMWVHALGESFRI